MDSTQKGRKWKVGWADPDVGSLDSRGNGEPDKVGEGG